MYLSRRLEYCTHYQFFASLVERSTFSLRERFRPAKLTRSAIEEAEAETKHQVRVHYKLDLSYVMQFLFPVEEYTIFAS